MAAEDEAAAALQIVALENPEEEAEVFHRQVDDLVSKTDQLEMRVNEIVEFYMNKKQGGGGGSGSKASCSSKCVANGGKEGGCSKRMQELIRQFGAIIHQITSTDRWASPFMNPVDVKGLGLDDYYEVVKKPMDFSTIQNRMEGKNGTRYTSVREIYSDVRLIFTNAMKYNDERHDYHIMAKKLLQKFEEKWIQLMPKVDEEEKRQKEEEAQAFANMKSAQEAAVARLARDTDDELSQINRHLEDLRKLVIRRCRKMSTDEKRKLGSGLCQLSPEDLNKALEIVAQDNPNFQPTAEEVDLDMDAQSEATLWRLKFFVKETLERQNNNAAGKADENAKRKREICNALAKTASKRIKKQPQ